MSTIPRPALFSYGFRPFFLLAGLFAAAVIPLWLAIWAGHAALAGPFGPRDWHIHEMLFGYVPAVLAGFLFTAIPNWTGRMPRRGLPLVALSGLWLLARLAVAGALALPAWAVMVLDLSFLLAVAAISVVEIVAGRNWRNLAVIVPVGLLAAANATFHIEAMTRGAADIGMRAGFACILFLILLIGGRIVPSFTRNWLSRQGPGPLPAPVGRFDRLALMASAAVLALWSLAPGLPGLSAAFAGLAGLHLLRLARWRGWRCGRAPILWILHIAYLFLPLGFAALALDAPVAGLHLLGIGAIGGMTLAVMMRASMGHTGRPLEAGRVLTASFLLLCAAALIRALLPDQGLGGISGPGLSGALWTAAFAGFVLKVGPWLTLPSVARRQPNPAARPRA
ncbi:NnrS family protein [Rhodovulum sulfidophilum]|uniref:NnrS family protein n=1 Tax=Rhodovulum sulfidophilum TaxID=35806 RepID=UPI000952BD52|nr:NnrS family protein [Rhodovulum sulfidophilum]MBL3552864.1 NnrS family protein [Rhodovulum sulfidophilum]OLS42642.1 short-chain dehydrogenase [Rhodovulum sulfidophilum]